MLRCLKNILFLFFVSVLLSCNSNTSSSANPIVLNVGDEYQGGVIFQVSGQSGKICATVDNSVALEWGGSGTEIGLTAQSATDGNSNTNAIVTVLGAATNYAAGLCDDYEVDSEGNTPCQLGNTCYEDWYLPAYQEMAAVFQQSTQLTLQNPSLGGPITGIQAAPYSTSSEASDISFWAINAASLGNAETAFKNSLLNVRCIRQF